MERDARALCVVSNRASLLPALEEIGRHGCDRAGAVQDRRAPGAAGHPQDPYPQGVALLSASFLAGAICCARAVATTAPDARRRAPSTTRKSPTTAPASRAGSIRAA